MKTKIFLSLCVTACLLAAWWMLARPSPVADTPFSIGLIAPQTGDAAAWGIPPAKGAELAIREINRAGGVSGHPLALKVEDDRCDPKTGVSAYRKLVAEGAKVIIGAVCSNVTLAIAPMAERDGVVLISPASTNPHITNAGDNIFRDVPSDALRGRVFADYLANKLGVHSVALLYIQNDSGIGAADSFSERFLVDGGTIVSRESYPVGASDIRSALLKVRASGAQAIVAISFPQDTAILMKESRELRLTQPFYYLTEAVEDPSVLTAAGAAAEGATYILPAPAEGTAASGFSSAYAKAYGELPALYAAEGYDAAKLLAAAMQNTKSEIDVSSIREYLYTVHDYPGASGIITFDHNGDVLKPFAIKRIVQGEPQLIETLGAD